MNLINPEFNPYDKLIVLEDVVDRLVDSNLSFHEVFDKSLDIYTDRLNQLIDIINFQSQQLDELHSRIRLLEVVRQHEQK